MGVLFSMGLITSWVEQIKDNAVRIFEGHVKIHGVEFFDQPIVDHAFPPPRTLTDRLREDDRVAGWSERVVVEGLLSTATKSRVVRIVGFDPETEPDVSVITSAVVDGEPFGHWSGRGKPVWVGRRLLDRIGRDVGKKLVLMSQQFGVNEVGSGSFRIAGVFDSGNGAFDENHVYILLDDAREMLSLEDRVTEVVVLLDDIDESDLFAAEVQAGLPAGELSARSWRLLMPMVEKQIELTGRIMIPYYAVFYIAMAFGVLNTLMMAIGERTHEIGVMLAVGMGRLRLVALILVEALFIALVAVVLGTLLGWSIVTWLGVRGIDLSALAEGLTYMGVARVIYPGLEAKGILVAAGVALAVSALFSLYPALRAAHLIPVEAIRKE